MKKVLTFFSSLLVICMLVACTDSNASYNSNLWDTLADNFQLKNETPNIPTVRKEIDWYMSHQTILLEITNASKPYLYYVYQQVKKRHMPAEIALLPFVESGYNPYARSSAGAVGLWQLMPGTASGYGVPINWWEDGRRNIVTSTNAALNYLEYLRKYFNGNWILAIAAYNSGQGTVRRAMLQNKQSHKSMHFFSLTLPTETKDYVPKLLALATIISHPNDYPVNLPAIPAGPYFGIVNIKSQIDLSYAAEMAGITLKQLTELNPGFNRWSSGPEGSHELLIPADKLNQFENALDNAPANKRIEWYRYRVKYGDTFSTLAKRFGTSAALLKSINYLYSNHLTVNTVLLIPKNNRAIKSIDVKNSQAYFRSLRRLPDVRVIQHKASHGETLNSIARHYRITVKQLEFWNSWKRHETLIPGMTLTIWPSKHYVPQGEIIYVVKKGDTLTKLVRRFKTTKKAILRHNQLTSDQLKIGQELNIPSIAVRQEPSVYIIKKGDSLTSIAKHYQVTTDALIRWNKVINPHHIKAGERLLIYAH